MINKMKKELVSQMIAELKSIESMRVALDALDRVEYSGAFDICDQLTTIKGSITNLEDALDKALHIIPTS